ncbi:MAG TPA: hypothetical protein VNQ76_02945 [Planctomicrobium sp.]|nr:hypothetical protein [Planctomicrobium sp.]
MNHVGKSERAAQNRITATVNKKLAMPENLIIELLDLPERGWKGDFVPILSNVAGTTFPPQVLLLSATVGYGLQRPL